MNSEIVRLIAAQISIHACMAGVRLAAPLLALRQGASPIAVGLLLALFALMQVFIALPGGRFADRHGLRLPVRLSVGTAVVGGLLAMTFPVYGALCVAALLTGAATCLSNIALQRHVGRLAETPTQLKQVFSWLAIGPAISNFLGPFAAGLMIDHAGHVAADDLGFRSAFLLMALLPLAGWGFIHRVRELPAIVQEATAGAVPPRAWHLLREPMFRRLILVNWFISSCWDVHTFVVPLLGHERGLSASAIGTILGAFAVAAACIRVVIPMLAEHLREWAVIMGAMIVVSAIFAVYPLLTTGIGMGCFSVLLGFALGSVQPMVMSTLHQITPEARHGEALGLRLMTINASSVSVPIAFGALGAAFGVASVFWLVGLVVGLGTRAAWRLRPTPADQSSL